MPDLARRISEARSGFDPRENIRRIKRAVVDEIVAVDRKVEVRVTDYFNHTYSPDLVLDWPHEGQSRFFYIRTDVDPGRLREDTSTLRDKHPVLFTLTAAASDQANKELRGLMTAVAETDTLVTNPVALEGVTRASAQSAVAGLASSALLQGGRGLVDDDAAQGVLEVFAAGFEAARETRAEGTAQAASVLHESFNRQSARRLTQFLQAVWVGSGGLSTSFPGTGDFSPDLSDDAIRFLLELQDLDDSAFWKRLGRGLTLDRLSTLGSGTTSTNFHRLVQANLDVLSARLCRVLKHPDQLLEEHSEFRWLVERGLVALRGSRFSAYVAARNDDMTIPNDGHPGLSGEQLIQRSSRIGRKVEQVGFESAEYRLSYESRRADITQDRALQNIANAIGDARVSTAAIQLPGSRSLRCDFESLTATGRGSATFPLPDLVETSLQIFVDLDEEESAQLQLLFEDWDVPEGQQTLF